MGARISHGHVDMCTLQNPRPDRLTINDPLCWLRLALQFRNVDRRHMTSCLGVSSAQSLINCILRGHADSLLIADLEDIVFPRCALIPLHTNSGPGSR